MDTEGQPPDPVRRLHELGEHEMADKLQKRLLRHPDDREGYSWRLRPDPKDTTDQRGSW